MFKQTTYKKSGGQLRTISTALLVSTIFLTATVAHAQTDTLNKYNSQGKKIGYWKVLIDNRADKVDSLQNAYFYGFELWDNGESVFQFFKHPSKFKKTTFDGILPEKGKPQLINGTLKCYNQYGFLRMEEVFKNGHPISLKSFTYLKHSDSRMYDITDTVPRLFEEVDYTKLYNNIPGTALYRIHSAYGNPTKEFWFRKGKKRWKSFRIKNNTST